MKIISVFLVLCLLVSTTCAHLCHLPFVSHFCPNFVNNEDLKSQCERKVGILSDTVSFIATKKAVLLPALGLGLYSGITVSALLEKANLFATSSLLSQVCRKFDDGEEHTTDELDYIEFELEDTRVKINDLMGDYDWIKSVFVQKEQEDQSKYARLEAMVAQVSAQLVQVKSEVVQLKSEVVQLKSEVVQVKSELVQVKSEVVQVKSEVVQVKSELVQVRSEVVQVKSELAFVKAELSQVQNSIDKPHIEETPEFLEKSLESQSKIILKSSQTYPRMNGLHKRPRSRQSPLASKHQLASLRPNMEHFRFSRSVPRKSRKIFSKPPKFPRKKPSPRLLKEKPFSNHNIKGVKLLVENGQVAPEPEFLPHHLNNGNVMK